MNGDEKLVLADGKNPVTKAPPFQKKKAVLCLYNALPAISLQNEGHIYFSQTTHTFCLIVLSFPTYAERPLIIYRNQDAAIA